MVPGSSDQMVGGISGSVAQLILSVNPGKEEQIGPVVDAYFTPVLQAHFAELSAVPAPPLPQNLPPRRPPPPPRLLPPRGGKKKTPRPGPSPSRHGNPEAPPPPPPPAQAEKKGPGRGRGAGGGRKGE